MITILTIPKYTGQYCQVYSHCWAAVTHRPSPKLFLLAELKFGTHLNTKSQLSTNSLCPGSLYSTFCLCEFGHSRCRILVDSYSICPLYLAYFTDCNILKVHGMFLHGSGISFLFKVESYSIVWTDHLSIHPSVRTWAASAFCHLAAVNTQFFGLFWGDLEGEFFKWVGHFQMK